LDSSRRNLLIGAGAVVVAGIGYFVWTRGSDNALTSNPGATKVPLSELLRPGPLPDMTMGAANAPVTIVEYASLTCPHCRHFEETTFPELKKRYIDTGKVRYIFREFVLNDVDLLAIALARCLGKDEYFPFVETLYQKQQDWAVDNPVQPLLAISKQAGMTEEKFKACASNQTVVSAVEAQRERAANQFGVDSTPTFFVNGERLVGALSLEDMEKAIKPYLTGA
jgi:protein-disulfide isomerase